LAEQVLLWHWLPMVQLCPVWPLQTCVPTLQPAVELAQSLFELQPHTLFTHA
jgi:hypothetical protein